MQPNPDKLKKDNENIDYDDDFEAQQNLLGFFSLLLEVDKRVNPHLYKKQKTTKPAEKEIKLKEEIKK
jgi:hypothetical protein